VEVDLLEMTTYSTVYRDDQAYMQDPSQKGDYFIFAICWYMR